jgi:hypothetical protein
MYTTGKIPENFKKSVIVMLPKKRKSTECEEYRSLSISKHPYKSQMKNQIDATLCRFYFCRVTLHVSGASAHHQEYLKLVQRLLVHVLSLQVAAVLVLNTPDDGRLRPKHVE